MNDVCTRRDEWHGEHTMISNRSKHIQMPFDVDILYNRISLYAIEFKGMYAIVWTRLSIVGVITQVGSMALFMFAINAHWDDI